MDESAAGHEGAGARRSLRAAGLAVGYAGTALIEDIALDLAAGTVLALIGPNGAGKSTILKTIAKYLAAIAGTVLIDGRSLVDLANRDLARRLAVVLTDRPKTERMTCEDVVATGRYPHTGRFGVLSKTDRAAVRRAMTLLDAWELRDLDFRHVSDGQRQRVLIARALAQEPRIVVLDEPTSHLDARYKLELLTILRRMAHEEGITVVMSLHELDLAQKVADLVMCVHDGRVDHVGPPEDVFADGRIDAVFDLGHGSFDPWFGSLEFAPPPGDPEVFVIAGGGAGVPVYRALQRRGVPFATGVLHVGDVDWRVGSRLAGEVIQEEAFTPISDAALARAVAALRRCRAVIDCLTTHALGNIRNRALTDQARQLGLPLCDDPADLSGFLGRPSSWSRGCGRSPGGLMASAAGLP
ncbi:MAG: ABC transporter ATP-binding protein [Propionibacteriaceae bacterium]|jgi:iron complex transport system ATP-binding protein|nr:ABC transporter ATP-binding protein [Propionibacteriaceae bacterium]